MYIYIFIAVCLVQGLEKSGTFLWRKIEGIQGPHDSRYCFVKQTHVTTITTVICFNFIKIRIPHLQTQRMQPMLAEKVFLN